MKTLYDAQDAGARYKVARALPSSTQQMWINVVKTIIEPLVPSRILDLGAGSGRFTVGLAEKFGVPVIAVEPSDSMRESGMRDCPATWLKGCAEKIPVENEAVDLIWMSQVFHHITDRDSAVREMFRVLKPGGCLAIRNGTIENNESLPWMKCFPDALAFDEKRIPTQRSLVRDVTAAGFACTWRATIHQLTARNYAEYAPKIAQRSLSSLIAISDEEFSRGLEALNEWVKEQDPNEPVFEAVDFFVFRK